MKTKKKFLTALSYLSNKKTFHYWMVREKIEPGPIERYYRQKPLGWIRSQENEGKSPGYMVWRGYGQKDAHLFAPFECFKKEINAFFK